jgi:hypothetical protein
LGDFILANVGIALLDKDRNVIETTVTDASRKYSFDSLVHDNYFVTQMDPIGDMHPNGIAVNGWASVL